MIERLLFRMARQLRIGWVTPPTADAIKKESLKKFLRPKIIGYQKKIVFRASAVVKA